jgi:hypothetical protein
VLHHPRFQGRRPNAALAKRLPPGQDKTHDFPVLSMGPTPRLAPSTVRLDLKVGPRLAASWRFDALRDLPQTAWRRDIHCVTTWSKFDTFSAGVTIDDLFDAAKVQPPTEQILAHSTDGCSTNLLLSDLTGGKATFGLTFCLEARRRQLGAADRGWIGRCDADLLRARPSGLADPPLALLMSARRRDDIPFRDECTSVFGRPQRALSCSTAQSTISREAVVTLSI